MCPISFNVYGVKLNEGHFSSRTVISRFWDKAIYLNPMAITLKWKDCWKQYLHHERSLLKRENCKCRIKFLENCRSADLIPKFLNFRISNNGCFEPTTIHNLQRKLLKEELFKAKKPLACWIQIESIEISVLPSTLLPSVLLFTRVTLFNTRKNVEATHTKILENLSKEQGRPMFNLHDTVKLFELDVVTPKYVLDTLALGPKNVLLEAFDHKVMLGDIDLLLNRLQE